MPTVGNEIDNPGIMIQIILTGGIWQVKPVEDEPEICLKNWSIREVHPAGTRHFVGWNVAGEGRVSSAIVEFDPKKLLGRTASGRVYALLGQPGYDADAEYVFSRWCRIPGQGAETVRDVTDDILRSLSA